MLSHMCSVGPSSRDGQDVNCNEALMRAKEENGPPRNEFDALQSFRQANNLTDDDYDRLKELSPNVSNNSRRNCKWQFPALM